MSLYPTLEDMEVSHMAATQNAAEQKLTQQAITAAGSGEQMDIASSLYPTLDEWMGMDSKALQVYQPLNATTGAVAPVTGGHQSHAEIKQGIRQVVGCKDPGSGKIGLSVENISKGVFVSYVESGSVAAKAGLRFGDQIVQINGESVAGWNKKKTIEFLKKADPTQIRFAVRDRPFERTITCVKDSNGHIGFQFKKGKINAIVKDSSAARNGMLTDHFITEIDGQNVVGMNDDKILKVIKSKDRTVTVTVMPEFVYDHMVKHLGSSLKKHMDHSEPTEL